jgi:hypothetical protein
MYYTLSSKTADLSPKKSMKSGMNPLTQSTLYIGFAGPGCCFVANKYDPSHINQ